MESRQVQGFVFEALENIARIKQDKVDYDAIPESKRIAVVLMQLEAEQSFTALMKLLSSHSLDVATFSADNLQALQPFYKFLADRWGRIQKSDAIYPFSPDSYINKACILLAELLSKIDGKPVFDKLMPPIESADHEFAQQGGLTKLKLHEFIIGNDGNPLSVELCFQFLEYKAEFDRARSSSRSSDLQRRTSKTSFNPPMRALTLEEEQLIANHSTEAAKYYQAIKANVNVAEARDAFQKAIRSDAYKVTSSYHEEGLNHLASVTLSQQRSPYDLAAVMYENVPRPQWSSFLASIKKEDLFKIVLGIDLAEISKSHQNAEKYKEAQLQKTDQVLLTLSNGNFTFRDENQLRAFMLCLNEAYKISRKEGPDFKTNTGYYVGYWLNWAYTKEQKISSSDVFRDFLMSNHPIHDLEGYLRQRKLYDQHWGPLTTFTKLGYNTLPNLVQLAIKSSKQFQNEKAQEHKVSY